MRLLSAAVVALITSTVTCRIPARPEQSFFDDPASEETFSQYAQKGGAMMCALTGSDQTAGRQIRDQRVPPSAASIWTGDLRNEMQTWYWRERDPATYSCKINSHWDFSAVMRGLGLNGEPAPQGDNKCYRVEHWDPDKTENGRQVPAILQWYKVGDKDYRATEAHFEFGINVKGGAIFGFFLTGPKEAAKSNWYSGRKDPELSELPQLRALSDILWGFWNRDNPNVKNIRYFFMIGISNDQTNELIASCLEKTSKELKEWPGVQFSTATEEGHALLGSPNGAAFAYFLMQHKAQLGHKTITKVTVLRPENDDDNDFVDASLVFHVEDAPEPPPDEGETSVLEKRDSSDMLRVHKLERMRSLY